MLTTGNIIKVFMLHLLHMSQLCHPNGQRINVQIGLALMFHTSSCIQHCHARVSVPPAVSQPVYHPRWLGPTQWPHTWRSDCTRVASAADKQPEHDSCPTKLRVGTVSSVLKMYTLRQTQQYDLYIRNIN